jgi:mannose-6-phosphate isomerase-like protein (cupin superfamily)
MTDDVRMTLEEIVPGAVSARSAPHYVWGDTCDGWRLADSQGLSVIEERMPPGTAEAWHVHDRARQFFYVLSGRAAMALQDGEVTLDAGCGLEIPPGTPHQMANRSAADVRFLVVSSPTTRGDRRSVLVPARDGARGPGRRV